MKNTELAMNDMNKLKHRKETVQKRQQMVMTSKHHPNIYTHTDSKSF